MVFGNTGGGDWGALVDFGGDFEVEGEELGEEVFLWIEAVGGQDRRIEGGVGVFEGVGAGEFEGAVEGPEAALEALEGRWSNIQISDFKGGNGTGGTRGGGKGATRRRGDPRTRRGGAGAARWEAGMWQCYSRTPFRTPFPATLREKVAQEDLVAVAMVNGHLGLGVLLPQALGALRVHFDKVGASIPELGAECELKKGRHARALCDGYGLAGGLLVHRLEGGFQMTVPAREERRRVVDEGERRRVLCRQARFNHRRPRPVAFC